MDPDSELLLRLRSGDELAVSLVERYQEQMLRLGRAAGALARGGGAPAGGGQAR